MSEWKTYKLGDICTKIGSGATPSGGKEAYKGGDYNLVRSQNVLDFSFSCEGLAQINEEQATKLNNVELQANDVLLNITGDSVARTCLVPTYVLPARVNQHVAIVRANKDILDCYYLLYFIQSQKTNLLSLASGGATRNALTKSMIENYEISLPSLSEQKRISSILKSLDDKIENNRKINENLEQQAQALFKSWFIDFEPFKDGKFIDSELGLIPEGWRVGKLGELCVTNNRTYGSNFQSPILYLDTGSVTNNVIEELKTLDPKTDKIPSRARRAVMEGDIVYSSVRPNLRHFAFMYNPQSNLVASTGFVVITANWSRLRYYIYQFLIQDSIVDSLQAIAEQSVSTYPSLNASDLTNLDIIIPQDDVIIKFAMICNSYFSQIYKNQNESQNLAKLRDTLLPKLMSGEIEV